MSNEPDEEYELLLTDASIDIAYVLKKTFIQPIALYVIPLHGAEIISKHVEAADARFSEVVRANTKPESELAK